MVQISELEVRQNNVDVEGTIIEIGETKTFNKFGRELRVADAVLKDDSGTIKLSLWNEDINKFKVGDKVKITNGYINEFQGEKQLTAGKFGKMEKIGEGEADSAVGEGQSQLSDETAETMAEDKAEDEAVEEAVEEKAPEGTSEEKVEEASEELEEAAEEPEEKSEEPEEKPSEEKPEESQEDF